MERFIYFERLRLFSLKTEHAIVKDERTIITWKTWPWSYGSLVITQSQRELTLIKLSRFNYRSELTRSTSISTGVEEGTSSFDLPERILSIQVKNDHLVLPNGISKWNILWSEMINLWHLAQSACSLSHPFCNIFCTDQLHLQSDSSADGTAWLYPFWLSLSLPNTASFLDT